MSGDTDHLSLPRGFQDVDSARMGLIRQLRSEWTEACSLFGYQAVEVPPVGFANTFTTGHNAAEGRNFDFDDRRGRRLALVSDSLPAVLRLASGLGRPESRLSYCSQVFRYVHRSRRYFHHLGLMDVSRRDDREHWSQQSLLRMIKVVAAFLANRIPMQVTLTSPGLWHAIAANCVSHQDPGALANDLRGVEPTRRADLLAARGAPPEILCLTELVATDPTQPMVGVEAPPAISHAIAECHRLAAALRDGGIDATVDLGSLHGSEFHDTTGFLLRDPRDHQVLGDGGSYGLFAQSFLRRDVGVQAAVLGLERVADIVTQARPAGASAADFALLTYPEALDQGTVLGDRLREAGIRVWDQTICGPVRHHLRELAELGIPASAIIGERERSEQTLRIRQLDGSMSSVAIVDLVAWLKGRQAIPGQSRRIDARSEA